MKQLFHAAICLAATMFFITAGAQNCKPDFSKVDKIEKKKIEAWSCELYETGLGASMFSSSQVYITFSIGKMDNLNFVQLQLQKREESLANQLTNSNFRAAKGNEFYFGMKDADPLKFVATEVTNETKTNGISGYIVTTVRLSSEIKEEDFAELKAALTTNLIDALRIKLENSNTVEQSVAAKRGTKMREKASCFFNAQQGKVPPKTEKIAETKTKPQPKENNNVKTKDDTGTKNTGPQNNKSATVKTNDNIVTAAESPDNSEQFEGVWISEEKKKVTLTITKINDRNYEVKEVVKVGPVKKNVSPCPTFEYINGELICKQFKIIYLPEKSSIYYDGNEYSKQ